MLLQETNQLQDGESNSAPSQLPVLDYRPFIAPPTGVYHLNLFLFGSEHNRSVSLHGVSF